MFRYRVNKHTFYIAAMIILLCLVSITGATYALFTNRADGKIGINATAGNLEVDITDPSGGNSLLGETLDFEIASTSPNGEALFEPGSYYYTEGFCVKNTGKTNLKFILYITEDTSLDADFYDAFDVWITTDKEGRSEPIDLPKFSEVLIPGAISDTYYLVFRMKEDAGNEFQNRTFTGIGVTACAVQGNVG